jgi:hypothetical protein
MREILSPARTSLLHPSSNYRSFPGPRVLLFTRLHPIYRLIDSPSSPAAASRTGKKRPGESAEETDSEAEVQQERDVSKNQNKRKAKRRNKKKKKTTTTGKKDVREEEAHSDDS